MLSFGRYSGRAHAHHVFACFLIAALSCYLLREARDPSAPPRIDESEWVTAGYVAFSLVRQLAPVSRWQRAFDERELGDWGNKNPPLGKLIIGAAVAPLVSSDAAVNYQASMSVPPERHRLPPSELLVAARTSIALSAALLLFATYLLASELLGRSLWASVAPLCLFLVPNFQWHATHVYTDVPQLAFMSLGAYAMLRHARTRRFRWYALALVAGGLACAVKFSAAVFCVATAVYALPALLRRRSDVRPLLAAAIVPVAVFIAVNPYLHDRPIDKSIQLVRDWRATKRAQQADSLLASGAVQDRARGFELVLVRAVLRAAPAQRDRVRGEATWAGAARRQPRRRPRARARTRSCSSRRAAAPRNGTRRRRDGRRDGGTCPRTRVHGLRCAVRCGHRGARPRAAGAPRARRACIRSRARDELAV
jgi:hypothetical protein